MTKGNNIGRAKYTLRRVRIKCERREVGAQG